MTTLFTPFAFFGQNVVNGSLNGTTIGNSMIYPTNVPGWSNCGFSPDLTSNSFPSYVSTSQVASCASPDGDPRLGLAALTECAQSSITGLTTGQTYYLCFYGACFGTGTSIYNSGPAVVDICAGTTCTTVSIPMVACAWNLYSLTFVATSPTMTLSATSPTGNSYASIDGFFLGENPSCMIPLSSRFSDFHTRKTENYSAELSWRAVPTSIQDYFVVERLSDIDTSWNEIGIIEVDNIQVKSYQWIDEQPILGKNYYRILGYDGNHELVESTDIRLEEFTHFNGESLSIYPNPAKNVITIIIADLKNEVMQIFSSDGKLVYSENILGNISEINISNLKQGIYYIQIGNEIKKLIKQ